MKKIVYGIVMALMVFVLMACNRSQEITLKLSYGERTGEYVGKLVDGLPEGEGKFTTSNESGDSWTYEGNFVKGHFDGEGKTTWSTGQIEIGTYKNDVIVPIKGEEIKTLFISPDELKNHYVEVSGKVFNKMVEDGTTYVQFYTDVKNYENDILAILPDDGDDINEDDYITVVGLVQDNTQTENIYGEELSIVTLLSKSYEKSSYIDAVDPAIDTIEVNESQKQYGYSLTLTKVEYSENAMRVYLTAKNNGSDKFSIYSFDAIVSQNGKQYKVNDNYEANYPDFDGDILVGNSVDAILEFQKIDGSFTLTIEGYSNNFDEDIKPFVFKVN